MSERAAVKMMNQLVAKHDKGKCNCDFTGDRDTWNRCWGMLLITGAVTETEMIDEIIWLDGVIE